MVHSCDDNEAVNQNEANSSSVFTQDTITHGVPVILEGIPLDSLEISKIPLRRGKKIRYRKNSILAPVPDTILIDYELAYNIPGNDSFSVPDTVDFYFSEIQLKYPRRVVAAKPQKPDFSNYDLQYFGIESGLPSASVMDVFCDKASNIWIAVVNKGVVRYDGYSFLHFTSDHGLVDESVQDIFQDSDGNLWFSTKKGVSRFNGDTFLNYELRTENDSWFNCTMEDDEGNFWFGTWDNGLVCLKDEKFLRYGPEQGLGSNTIYCIQKDNDGDLWLGQRNNGLGIYDGTGFRTHPAGKVIRQSVRAIDFEKNGAAWLGTEHGMIKFDGTYFYDYQNTRFLGSSLVWEVLVDRDGILWTACFQKGIFSFDGQTVVHYDKNEGLSSNTSRSFAEDKHGRLWMSTDNGGVNILNKKGFKYVQIVEEVENMNVMDIIWYKDELWVQIHTYGNLAIKGDELVRMRNSPNQLGREFYVDSNDDLWIASMYYLFHFKNDTLTNYDLKKNGDFANVRSITEDSQGNMWFGRENGLMEFDGENFTSYNADNEFTNDAVHAICRDGEKIWIGTQGSGLWKYESGSFVRYSAAEGLPAKKISALYKNDRGLWVGSDGGGIYLLSDGAIINFTTEDGLSDNYIRSFIEDKNENLWISTENGLSIYDGKRFIAYTNQSGLNMNQFYRGSVAIDDEENIWWGSAKGLVTINAATYEMDSVVPSIQLNDVLLEQEAVNYRELEHALENDQDYFIADSSLNLNTVVFDSISKYQNAPHGLVLPHFINQVSLIFSSADINGSQQFKYSYMLEGSENNWSPLSPENKATFNNLTQGEYTFKVKAQNQFGVWSEELSYPFVIQTPWWLSVWAYLIYLMLFVTILYSAYRIRTSAYRKRQMELESTVADRTSELKYQKEQVEIHNLEMKDSIRYAKRIQKAILPPAKFVRACLPNSFGLYKPKDIVAGDFYWLESVDDKVIIAAADCTGHGVPGAMVSVVCHNALNRCVREFSLRDPGEILDKVNELVEETFGKSEQEVKDGMDIALCSLKGNKLLYAGANNPLWIIQDGAILETKADKQPIGSFNEHKPYTTHSFDLENGDTFYIFSDGFVDQFGGPRGKKFKPKALRKLLLSIQDKNMKDQKVLIDEAFENWKGDLDQVDDICVIGVRVK